MPIKSINNMVMEKCLQKKKIVKKIKKKVLIIKITFYYVCVCVT